MSRTRKQNSKYQAAGDRRSQRQAAARAQRRGDLSIRRLGGTAVDLATTESEALAELERVHSGGLPRGRRAHREPAHD